MNSINLMVIAVATAIIVTLPAHASMSLISSYKNPAKLHTTAGSQTSMLGTTSRSTDQTAKIIKIAARKKTAPKNIGKGAVKCLRSRPCRKGFTKGAKKGWNAGKKYGGKAWRGTKKVSKKAWRGTKKVGKKAWKGTKWVAKETGKATGLDSQTKCTILSRWCDGEGI